MNYGSESFWNERYSAIGDRGEKNYDWYVIYSKNNFGHLIFFYRNNDMCSKTLVVGRIAFVMLYLINFRSLRIGIVHGPLYIKFFALTCPKAQWGQQVMVLLKF